MHWIKHGLTYRPDGRSSWARNSALTPTPVLMDDLIRVYVGFRDDQGISRIGYVDVMADNPSQIVDVSMEPVLDVGSPGTFDDNGVILGDVIQHGPSLRMYYVGFQLVEKVKFLAFSGLATSNDGGKSFQRVQRTPILDRAEEGTFIRAIHSVHCQNGQWRIWYAAGDGWEQINGVPYPRYHIRTLQSPDGIQFASEGTTCLLPHGDEYRIGRPRVYSMASGYRMFFTKGSRSGEYFPGYAISMDGIHWQRDDASLGVVLSTDGWDSRHLCYPSLIMNKDRTYIFYNGNDMGRDGFGYAELID